MKLIENPNENFISKLTKSFSTPFWYCGPLGSIQVGVDYHSKWNLIQLFSFPNLKPFKYYRNSISSIRF